MTMRQHKKSLIDSVSQIVSLNHSYDDEDIGWRDNLMDSISVG